MTIMTSSEPIARAIPATVAGTTAQTSSAPGPATIGAEVLRSPSRLN
jgi:hypothetical protein